MSLEKLDRKRPVNPPRPAKGGAFLLVQIPYSQFAEASSKQE